MNIKNFETLKPFFKHSLQKVFLYLLVLCYKRCKNKHFSIENIGMAKTISNRLTVKCRYTEGEIRTIGKTAVRFPIEIET